MREMASKLDSKGRANIYKTQVRSIVNYSCQAWRNSYNTSFSQLDIIQRKAQKMIRVDVDRTFPAVCHQ